MARVLIIDDDLLVCEMLSNIIQSMGHSVTCSHRLKNGLREAEGKIFDLVLLDVGLPDGNGLDAIPRIQEAEPAPPIIIITATGDRNGAELAIRKGAWDYIEKPASVHDMTLPIMRALQYRHERKVESPAAPKVLSLDGIVGNCPKMKSCFELVAQASNSDINVLITGETGTGKELFASAIHNNGLRAKKPFVVVDCSALPETLVESILFGHDKGAFTGAEKTREGLIKQADGGTLFLDEVGELPLTIQKAFLRVLQEHRFRPVGKSTEIASDFRLIAATNRNLQEMVQEGTFRSDFLFRLRSLVIELPPLRDRVEDIGDIAKHYVAKLCDRYGIGMKGFSPNFVGSLCAYGWPGNVRELLHALERAIAAAFHEPTLFPQHLPEHIRIDLVKHSIKPTNSSRKKTDTVSDLPRAFPSFRDHRDNTDLAYFTELISLTKGNMKEACRISGLSRSRLYDLLKHHRIVYSAPTQS